MASQKRFVPTTNSIGLISQQNIDKIYKNNNSKLISKLAENKIKRQVSHTKIATSNEERLKITQLDAKRVAESQSIVYN